MTNQTAVKRPLFVFCMTFFSAGILTAGVSYKVKLYLIVAGALALVLSALFDIVTRRRFNIFCIALITALPLLLSSLHQQLTVDGAISELERFDGVTDRVTVTIEDTRYSSSYFGYYTARISDGGAIPDMTVSLGFPDGSCEIGDVLTGDVTLRTVDGNTSFDEATYFIPDGILMCAEAESLIYAGKDGDVSLGGFFSKLNRSLTSRILAHSEGGELACAVLLGRRDLLNPSVKRDFGRIGISHLLAVSGIHLSVAVAALETILTTLKIRRRKKTLFLSGAVLFIMALLGFTKSVTRAGAMHLLRYLGNLLGRRTDGLTNLGSAAFIIMIADPFAVYDTGFILSVLASYSCIVYSRHTKDRPPVKSGFKRVSRGILDTVKLTLLITGLTLPVMWKVFGRVSLISPLTNVVFIPAVTVFMYLSLIYVFLCGIPCVNVFLTPVLLYAERLISVCAGKLSVLRGIEVSLKGMAVGVAAVLVFLSLLCATFFFKKHRAVSAATVGLCTLSLAVCLMLGHISDAKSAEAVYITKGKSEGFSIRCGTEYVLIDVSDGSSGFSRELTFAAEESGAVEISALVLTHLHRRHLSSVAAVADNRIVRLAMLPEPVTDDDREVAEALCSLFVKRGIPYSFYSRDDSVFRAGGVTFTSFGYTMLSRSTHPVVSFGFSAGGKSFAYLGSSAGEKSALPDSVMTADTVFLGAHPPVRKRQVTVVTKGSAVMSQKANEKDFLTVEAEKGCVNLNEDAVYSVGRYKR